MAVQDLPAEMWIHVLRFVPLGDRLKNVQFVNRRLHHLCYDLTLARHVDFRSSVFMPDKVALHYIQRVKNWIVTLSLTGCHWFTSHLLGKIPKLASLETLDLMGCFITGSQLYRLLTQAPKLKNLSASLELSEFSSFADRNKLNLSLDRLHFESVFLSRALNPEQYVGMWNRLADTLPRPRKSMSFDSYGVRDDSFLQPSVGLEPDAIYINCSIFSSTFSPSIFDVLHHNTDLHENVPVTNDFPTGVDFSKLRFLHLPKSAFSVSTALTHTCVSSRFPNVLPELQCFIVEWKPCFRMCYDTLKKNILHSECPNLKCLNLGCSEDRYYNFRSSFDANFYSRVSSFKNLQELNLRNLPIDLYLLLDSIKDLKQIHSLSIPLNESIVKNGDDVARGSSQSGTSQSGNRVSRICEVDNVVFFSKLVEFFPDLKKLEITQSLALFNKFPHPSFLRPVCKLSKLELLSLNGIRCIEPLCNTLNGCTRLTTLALTDVGSSLCDYGRFLSGLSSFSPLLVELRLRHTGLALSPMLIREITRFKALRKLILKGDANFHILTASAVHEHFVKILNACPVLHMFAFLAYGLAYSAVCEVRKLARQLKKSGRNAALFCGAPRIHMPCQVPPSMVRDVVFNSLVGVYNPFNFPYTE